MALSRLVQGGPTGGEGEGAPAWPGAQPPHVRSASERYRAAPSANVARGRHSARTIPQEAREPGPALSYLPRRVLEERARASDATAAALGRAIGRAVQRATAGDWWTLVAPQPWVNGLRRWHVPSATTAGEWYIVWETRPNAPQWWQRFGCNCAAAASTHYAVCWHRAAVWVRLQVVSSMTEG